LLHIVKVNTLKGRNKMKKIIASALILSMLAGCGQPLTINGPNNTSKTYPTYGLFNADENKSKLMCYETSIGNVVWSIILIETIIAPIYFIGFDIENPVGYKNAAGNCGIDARS
jgi:hypothetical protein